MEKNPTPAFLFTTDKDSEEKKHGGKKRLETH